MFLRNRTLSLIILYSFTSLLACAVNLVSDQPSLSATLAPGHTQLLHLTITSSGGPLSGLTLSTSGGSWLEVAPTSAVSTPVSVFVFVNARGVAEGVYDGAIKVTASGAANSPLSIPVRLTVGSGTPGPGPGPGPGPTSSFSADSTTLTFSGVAGDLSPAAQQLNVTSTPSGMSFSVSAKPNDTGNWLQATPASATAPAAITVTVNTSGMKAGSYSGTVTLTPTTGDAVTVNVSLTLTSGSGLNVSAKGLQFFYQLSASAPLPASQTFNVTGGATALNFTVSATTTASEATGWLSATPTSGSTPQPITVSVSPQKLAAGVYNGKITVSAPSIPDASIDVPVTLTVGSETQLTVGAAPAPFVFQTGGTAPAAQSVALGNLGTPLTFKISTATIDGGSWLAASPLTGTTPQALTIAVNPASLTPGSYSGTVTVSAVGAVNSPVTIPVTLNISSTSTLAASASSVVLNHQVGGLNEVVSQPIVVTSTSGPVTGTAAATMSASNCGPAWLEVFPNSFVTPATVNVALNGNGLSPGQSCLGSLVLTGGGTPIQIPVTAYVAATPFFNIRPLSLNLSARYQASAPAIQTVDLSMTDNSSATFTATASTSGTGPWLGVTPSSGSTQKSLTVTAEPVSLGVGTYTGSIKITSPALPQAQTIPVTFQVTPGTVATVTPASLVFTQTAGGALPSAQNVTISTTEGSQSFIASFVKGTLPASAVSVTPVSGTTPIVLSIRILSNSLAAGSYDGTVNIALPAAGSNPTSIPITLKVTNPATPPAVSVTPASLTFSYQRGSDAPSPQTINATSTGGAVNLAAAAATDSGGEWLAVTPGSGTTPGTFTLSVNPASLATGSYKGTVTLTATGSTGTPIKIPVLLGVTDPPVATPKISGISNAASGVRGAVSPGEIVSLGGDGLGSEPGTSFNFTSDGSVTQTLAGTKVLFDEFAAPLLYVSAHQINALVPYEVAGRTRVQVTVLKDVLQSNPYTIQVGTAVPGIFTATQNGRGQGAILNEDNTYNSPAFPAARGSIVQVFGTGEGLLQPAAVTGSVTQALHIPLGKLRATVGELSAQVVFAGAAPQAITGLFQVNVRIPEEALTGNVLIKISVDGADSQTGVTVAVN